MSVPLSSTPTSETACVLFMDIVDYSRVPMDFQLRVVRELQQMVRGTPEYRRSEATGDLITLPTGDGMALVFFRDVVAPIQCAMQIAGAINELDAVEIRMGIHTGPVYRVEDINANANVSGGGINFAQRVMDCGDAGHILVSKQYRDQILQIGHWPLQDLGECEVKHGVTLHLYNLYTGEVGNPALPVKLRPRGVIISSPGAPAHGSGKRKVCLLYKRNAQPDEKLLQTIEQFLITHGHEVFVDRNLVVGMQWAAEIDRQIRSSDAVIPLLSQQSVQNEMVAYEIQSANEEAQKSGKPQMLPIRVNYTGPLPETLAPILDPIEYVLWEGGDDTDRVLANLKLALSGPSDAVKVVPRTRLEPVGGAVPLDSTFYVVRNTDDEFRTAISRQDSIILIKGARQMGKTSLLARGLHQARQGGGKVILTDFQKLNKDQLESAQSLFMALGEWIADQLNLEVYPDEVWNERRGPSVNFERYLRREVLNKIEQPLVWAMDEVDRLFERDYASEVFGLFRSWHNERSLDPSGPWSRLTLAVAYATEAHLFISDINQSPFNVGTRLVMEDFYFEQVEDLNRRYGGPLRSEAETARFYRVVSGQPYLVRRGLHEMVMRGMDVSAFEAQADREEGFYGDHLRRMLVLLSKDAVRTEELREVLRGNPCPSPEGFYRLRASGILSGEAPREARLRCRLYESYLKRHLL